MKKTLLFLLFPSALFAQGVTYEDLRLPDINGKVTFQEVVDIPDTKADELYNRSKLWFVDFFRSSEHVIEMDSQDLGVIVGNGLTSIYQEPLGIEVETKVHFTVKIETKENRARYTLTNFAMTNSTNDRVPIETFFSERYMFKKNGKPYKASLIWHEKFLQEISSIEYSIQNGLSKSVTSDW